jgi:O-antigen ligase
MLKKLYTLLFFIGLFFFGFNEFEGIPQLGEFKNEAGALFFIAGFALLVADGKIGIPIKNPMFKILLIFLAWCIVTTLLNLPTVIESYFKHTYGLNRFVRQYFSLILSTIVFLMLYWNVIKNMPIKDILLKIRKVFFLSLIVASAYGFFETLFVVFHIGPALTVLNLFAYFPFLEPEVHTERISSIAYEAPFLAIYLITIAGWMFSYILTEKKWYKFLPTLAILVLTYYSGSRTGLMVIFVQLLIFSSFLYKSRKYRMYIGYAALFVVFSGAVLLAINSEKVIKSVETKLESFDFVGNLKNNISNKSRFGIQYASLRVFEESPVIGVGFGQQSYHSRFHYPGWATKNNYEFELWYKNPNEKAFPPGYNIYTRMLAETGIIGTLLFLWLLYTVIKRARILTKTRADEEKVLAIIILITFVGFAINWLQIDTFRLYGFWLCLAILMRMNTQKTAYEPIDSINSPLQ